MLRRRGTFESDLAALAAACEAGLDLAGVLARACAAVAADLGSGRVAAYVLSEDGASLDRLAGDGPAAIAPPEHDGPRLRDGDLVVPLVSARRTLGAIVAAAPRRTDPSRARVVAALAAQAVEAARLWASAGAAGGTHDLLTGLPNHRGVHDQLAGELARAQRAGDALAVAVVDVDAFGRYNERHGHGEADRLLREAARCFDDGVRLYDCVGRLGPDEFALVLPGMEAGAAAALVQRVAAAFSRTYPAVSFSGGVAAFPEHGATAPELVRLATGALYWAQRGGGGRVVAYDPAVVEALSAEERAAQLERDVYSRTVRALEAVRGQSAHARAVSDYTGFLGAELGLPPERVERLRLAAFLYDTTTPGADAEERSRLSARVAANALDAEAAEWLLAPRTPTGETPIEARIIAVADAFVGAGGHQSSAGAGRALAGLWRGAGTAYDADCVRALEALLAERLD